MRSLFFVLGMAQILVKFVSTQQNFSPSIQHSVLKFNALFAKFVKDELKPEENAVFSPLNIHTALSLLQLGSTGETRNELSNALGISTSDAGLSTVHQDLGKILNDLQATNAAEVKIANSIFVHKELQLKDGYLQVCRNYYKSEAQRVNFTKASETTAIINNWVSNNTKNRIPILFKNIIPPSTRLLLTSTLFFNATWQELFKKWLTKDEKFNTGVKEIVVKMMHELNYVPYIKIEKSDIEAISLPYQNNEFQMAVILPYGNKSLSSFVDDLKPERQQEIIGEFRLKREYVDYKIPRFKFAWSQNINNQIMKLGVRKMFDLAELDDMVQTSVPLKVKEINHANEIQVDEDGTIATAATAIRVVPVSVEYHPQEPIKFHVNRPFLFWIFHQRTGIILFSGIVQNPLM